MDKLEVNGAALLEQTTRLERLVIKDGGEIKVPEGKNVTLTVNGVHQDIAPGIYEGDVVLSVTEGFGRSGGFGPPGPVPTNFTAAIRAENGQICEEKSVLAAVRGEMPSEGIIKDIAISSQGNKLGGIDLKDGSYQLNHVSVQMNGYGGNDFSGQGAAVSVSGNAQVEIDGLTVENAGVIRSGVIVTDDAAVTVRNSRIVAMGGDAEQYNAADADVGGMLCVPWQLGLQGNCRATSVLTRGSVDYIESEISAQGWGALSVDGTAESQSWEDYSIHLGTKNCKVNILGPSGYGAFSIGPCKDVFEDTVFHVPDYALIQANETASADFQGCTVNSGRFGVMSYANQGGTLNVENSTFNTGSATFLIKGCYPQITVKNSILNSDDGTLLQMIDCDDPNYGLTGMDLDAQVPEKISAHDVTKVNYHDFYLYNKLLCKNKPTDVQATFRDMSLYGNLYNAISNTCPVGTYNPNPAPAGPPPEQLEKMIEKGEIEPPAPDDMPNFTKTPSTAYPANLFVRLVNVNYEGVVTASVARHAVKRSGRENYAELGKVRNTPCPVVNNGVILSLDEASSWTVSGECYLSALYIAKGTNVSGKDGKSVHMSVDGKPQPIVPGSYCGNIVISLK